MKNFEEWKESQPRTTDWDKYRERFDLIFRKKQPEKTNEPRENNPEGEAELRPKSP